MGSVEVSWTLSLLGHLTWLILIDQWILQQSFSDWPLVEFSKCYLIACEPFVLILSYFNSTAWYNGSLIVWVVTENSYKESWLEALPRTPFIEV